MKILLLLLENNLYAFGILYASCFATWKSSSCLFEEPCMRQPTGGRVGLLIEEPCKQAVDGSQWEMPCMLHAGCAVRGCWMARRCMLALYYWPHERTQGIDMSGSRSPFCSGCKAVSPGINPSKGPCRRLPWYAGINLCTLYVGTEGVFKRYKGLSL